MDELLLEIVLPFFLFTAVAFILYLLFNLSVSGIVTALLVSALVLIIIDILLEGI